MAPATEAVDPQLLAQALEETIDPQARLDLERLNELLSQNPLYSYHPNKKQLPFHEAKTRVKVFLGGNRSGKSTAGVVDDIIQACDRSAIPSWLQDFKIWEPPFHCRIVTPTLKLPHKAVLETMRKWVPATQLRGGAFDKAYEKQDKVLWFANGSFIEFMSMEQELDEFGGSARHRVHMDEEPDGEKGEAIRQECEQRLMDYRGDELFTFTPLNGLGWTFEEFEEEKGPEVQKEVWLSPRMVVVQAWTDDNPVIDPEEIEERSARLPERVREARRKGTFQAFKGLVYDMFDPDLHVVDTPNRQHVHSLDCWEAIDPGVNTTAVVFGGFDKNNALLVYDELYLHDEAAIPENAAKRIFAKREQWRIKPSYTLIDPSGANRDLVRQDNVRSAYARAGIRTAKAKNDVEGGVFEVMRRLEHKDAEGNPDSLLLIARNCSNLIREKRRYRIKETNDGSFAVVKKDDHLLDGERYLCMARPTAPRPSAKARPARQEWIPGTAPPARLSVKEPSGPMGKFS